VSSYDIAYLQNGILATDLARILSGLTDEYFVMVQDDCIVLMREAK
jgi:hypothetical protein